MTGSAVTELGFAEYAPGTVMLRMAPIPPEASIFTRAENLVPVPVVPVTVAVAFAVPLVPAAVIVADVTRVVPIVTIALVAAVPPRRVIVCVGAGIEASGRWDDLEKFGCLHLYLCGDGIDASRQNDGSASNIG